jgi:hypothetical protein
VAPAVFVEAAVAFSFISSTNAEFPHFLVSPFFLMNHREPQPCAITGAPFPVLWIVTNSGAHGPFTRESRAGSLELWLRMHRKSVAIGSIAALAVAILWARS